jgi:1,4-alpha-glucan branching enzyme
MKRYTRFVRSINWLYFLETSFYENDFCGRGFSLINVKHENVLAFKRISTFRGDRIVLINFSPDFIDGVVVPSDQGAEYYETIFNSNEKRFGGRGGTILAKYRVRKRTWDFTVHLPPLCAVVLKPIVINY